MKDKQQGSTLIARRSDGGERGATVTAYRCVDTGSTVVTNMVAKGPRSPFTGGAMQVVDANEKMEIASNELEACLAHVGKCSNDKCGVLLYTAKDEVASFVGEKPHCPVCATVFTPESEAITAAAAEAETAGKKTPFNNPNADPELDDDFDGQVVLLDDDGEGDDDDDDESGDEETNVMVDDDGYLVDSEGNYVDAEGEPVDEPILAEDAEDEGDDNDEDDAGDLANAKEQGAAMTGTLDKAVLLMVNGYMQLAQDEGIKKAEDFNAVTAALETASGSVSKLTDKDSITPAKAFQLALANDEDEVVSKMLDSITDTDKDLATGFAEASALFDGKVKAETKAAWDALAAAYATPVVEAAAKKDEPAADAGKDKSDADKPADGDKKDADKSADDKSGEKAAADKSGKDKAGDKPTDADASKTEADKQAEKDAADKGDKKDADTAAAGGDKDKDGKESDDDKSKDADKPSTPHKDDEAAAAKPGLGAKFDLDVTAAMDFDPRSLIITPVAPGVFGVFATVGKGIEPVGTMRVENASADNRSMYQGDGKPDLARKALLATIEQGSDYAPLGFVPITAQVEVDQIVAEQVATETEKATASIQETAGGSVEDFKQSMQIAAAGMNKGLYKNPLVASLTTELKRRGVQNASMVATRIVTTAADEYMGAVLEKATEFTGQSLEARNAVAKVVEGAEVSLQAEDEDDNTVTATAHVATPAPAEVASTKEKDNVVPIARKNLFADVGMSGLRA